jgi:hypothetical protein
MAEELTVVSWNVNGARRGRKWEPIRRKLDELGVDVALLQEAHPDWLEGLRAVYRPEGIDARDERDRPWGSAVVALNDRVSLEPVTHVQGTWRGHVSTPAPLACVETGHVAVARAFTPVGDLTLVSAYGTIEFGYAAGTLLRALADLEPIFDDPVRGIDLLIAGDWNVGTWWSGDDRKYAQRHGAVLALLNAYGLVDCIDAHLPAGRGRLHGCGCELGDSCRHVRTYRKDSKAVPYQDDYAYATTAFAGRVTRAEPDPAWDWEADLSDHIPLVVTVA